MSHQLKVLKPLVIADSMLISSDVPETDYPAWSAAATYATGVRVVLVSQHKIYESVADGNTGNDPTATPAIPKWAEVGATNRWKPFDKSISSQAKKEGSISYRIRPGCAITALTALNLVGVVLVRVRMIDPTFGTVFDKSVNMASQPIATGWWMWFFGERRQPTQLLLQDLPSYPGADLLIEFTGTQDLSVGVILLGQMRSFALGVRSGVRLGIDDFSRKERNRWGDLSFQEGAFANRVSCSLLLPWKEVDPLHQFLSSVRATPCFWVVSRRHESGSVYGIYKSFELVLSYADYADCEIELEGLT